MDDLIYNQTKIPKEKWRYGLRTSAATGCGWVATYNALRLMDYRAEPEELIRYYENGQWRADYQLDEEGGLPTGLKRGVLSQDGLYDLLSGLERRN